MINKLISYTKAYTYFVIMDSLLFVILFAFGLYFKNSILLLILSFLPLLHIAAVLKGIKDINEKKKTVSFKIYNKLLSRYNRLYYRNFVIIFLINLFVYGLELMLKIRNYAVLFVFLAIEFIVLFLIVRTYNQTNSLIINKYKKNDFEVTNANN